MTTPAEPVRPDDGRTAFFAYYMIRLNHSRADADGGDNELVGMVERLATGEKRSFESAAELMRLLGSWSALRGRPSGGVRL